MRCEDALELIQRSLDEELSEAEQERLQSHLSVCTSCSDFQSRLKRLDEHLSLLPHVHPPVSVVDRILPQLEKPMPTRTFRRWFTKMGWISGGIAAAIAIIIGAIFTQWGIPEEHTPPKPPVATNPSGGTSAKDHPSSGQQPVVGASVEDTGDKAEWSPHRRYQAVVSGNRVEVRTREGKLWYRSSAWQNGGKAQLSWADDRKLIVLIVWHGKDGQAKSVLKKYDVVHKQEEK
ncbi:zf-HC2 domain-containing protein [Polycladomyces subterraneus]|uniref:Zf-HC2 domain-containing protein n=1 Tax=Polycladomyces subterraneus TaxID=1016997 RepID=A0ABT8IQT2_9BACL|nr:zf-HC2 domain-containing protein [Polycladomyces subterraneus]MDN4594767.1 zf-HC2 domain-containing protein [Polycladomyces subterraneus]